MRIIDFHTHAFSDKVAENAIPALEKEADITTCHNGTMSGLLHSMNTAGIETAVRCSIATKPSRFFQILDWSLSIQSDRIYPLASVHPDDENFAEHIYEVKKAGLWGI